MSRANPLLILIFLFLLPVTLAAQVTIEDAYPNLSFDAPIDFQYASESGNEVYVAERAGRILVFENSPATNETSEFLDIASQVNASGEGGLLGFAFHPDYESNGYFYVYYTTGDPFRSVISRFGVSGSSGAADPASELVLLEVNQPYTNHNAGQIRFGPDGYLYIALGDGGSGGDPMDNGQDRSTLLGSILRIDVDETSEGMNYGIPFDNPFVENTQGYREEIYAYGLRNPYRFSFDRETGELWAGDVGQSSREEIDIIEKGMNYGWNTMEGSLCYEPSTGCDTSGKVLPVFEYDRSEGRSITGGFVYRGDEIPELTGRYVYADFATGQIWSLAWDGETASDNQLIDTFPGNQIITFGEDQDGELYMGSFDGNIYRFKSTDVTSNEGEDGLPSSINLSQNYPNPFNPSTRIRYELPEAMNVDLRVYNILGQEINILVKQQQSAGVHSVRFDGSNLTSGIYIYKLRAGNTLLTRKMTLMK